VVDPASASTLAPHDQIDAASVFPSQPLAIERCNDHLNPPNTSFDYNQELDDHDVLASIGSVGDAYDNAMAESFVDSFKTELIADRVWRSRSQLELAIVAYVGWFNHQRLHSALGDIPPAEFEALHEFRYAAASH
jgi:putative transposase